jgi:pimeloyl-ACP methyl ester carboxylesterase
VGDSQRVDPAGGRAAGFTFDTLWQQDVTASIAHVREATGGGPIDAVGHSMGGMLLYAYLSQGGEGLARVVTLGSPTRLDHGSPIWSAALKLTGVVPAGWMVPSGSLSPLTAPFQGGLDGDPLQLLLYNPQNVSPALWSRFLVTGVGDVSGALLLQLAALARDGQFASADGSVDYRAGLARVKTPVLVVAGKVDRMCTPMAAWDAYRSLGGERQWLLVARENGAQADYGHMDFVLGERARFEVWPQILGFLDRTAPPETVDQAPQR